MPLSLAVIGDLHYLGTLIEEEKGEEMDALVKQLLRSDGQLFSSLTLFLLVCFISFYIVFKLERRSKDNLPPSPPKIPVIGNLHQLGTLLHRSFAALSQKYGPIMLLHLGQTPTLVISSADLAREIVKTHDVFFSSRPQTTGAKIFLHGGKDVAFAPYGEEWRQKRKFSVLELLSVKRVLSFHSIRAEEVADLVYEIQKASLNDDGCSVNLSKMLIAASSNIVSRCVLGHKCSTRDGNSKFGELARKALTQFVAFSVGDFFPSLSWIDIVRGLVPKMKATFGELDDFFDEVIAEHKKARRDQNDADKKDFVDILLQLQEDGNTEFELTQETFKAILMDMFVGGSDTSSTTLEWAFAELLKNPITLKKAQEEVRRVVGHKSRVHDDDLNQMKYLKCVVKENLRLHPPLPFLLPRETTASVKLSGYDIPPKTNVLVNAWAIQRNSELWDRPEDFLPERFENSDIDFKGQHFQLTPFGIGRRGCPGVSFGIASVECILANLLYCFDWKLPTSGGAVQDVDMTEVYGLTVYKKEPLHVVPIPYSLGSTP